MQLEQMYVALLHALHCILRTGHKPATRPAEPIVTCRFRRECCRGYNIGVRIVDEFFAKNRGAKCRNFKETMETLARVRDRIADFKPHTKRPRPLTLHACSLVACECRMPSKCFSASPLLLRGGTQKAPSAH